MVTRRSSGESLRRAVEGGIGVIAGIVGSWRSSSAPPVGRKREEEIEREREMEDVVMEDEEVQVQLEDTRGRERGRRRSLG
jgi:hypothetical protein